MEKIITNTTKTPRGYYDDRGLHIVKPGDSITLYFADSQVQTIAIKLEDLSNPPPGCKKIKNLYVNPETGKTVVEFKDEPEPEE